MLQCFQDMFGDRLGRCLVIMLLGLLAEGQSNAQPASPTPSDTPLLDATRTSSPTPTSTPSPVLLDFNPDLNGNGVIDSEDLLAFISAWRLRDFVQPSPTPPYTVVTGFVTSASTNLGVRGAWILAGTAAVQSEDSGFFRIGSARTDTETVLVEKDGFSRFEEALRIEIPVTLLQVVLFPVGFPTFAPTRTPTFTTTPTPTISPTADSNTSATPTPSDSLPGQTETPTPSVSSTFTFTPTSTSTPTSSPTSTSTPTPTTVPLLGIWTGNLNPTGGVVFNNTPITWTVMGSNRAVAGVLDLVFDGPYTFTPPGTVYFQVVNQQDSLELNLIWDGGDGLGGTFDLTVQSEPPFAQESGQVTLSRSGR